MVSPSGLAANVFPSTGGVNQLGETEPKRLDQVGGKIAQTAAPRKSRLAAISAWLTTASSIAFRSRRHRLARGQ